MSPILSYIGPGAGFAFLGSFLILIVALLLALLAIASWPFRLLISASIRRTSKREKTPVKRVIILGLDGLDPRRLRRLMNEDKVPHFKALEQEGAFRHLSSTCPPISPVAWSSFMTGTNPGKHNIYDFLSRNYRTYLPELSSARITGTTDRSQSGAVLLRKSKPFWRTLDEHGIFSIILRVPITFPPEKFNGLSLSGMCVPDLRGTQGSFTWYTDQPISEEEPTGGQRVTISFERHTAKTRLTGPTLNGTKLSIPLSIKRDPERQSALLKVSGKRIRLKEGTYSDWIQVRYRVTPFRSASGICRFYARRISPLFELYVTPIHLDPERPAMPISHPLYYSIYLAKLMGPFATLGLAEDTWALNEGVIDDQTFVHQVYDIHAERETMFFESLKRIRRGLCVCVFDASDRIQHMFMRHHDPAKDPTPEEGTIDEMYIKMDGLVGRVRERIKEDDILMVISDHGFTDFKRGVNLNAWLMREGYLHLLPDKENSKYLRNIDWSRTRAYAFGLTGIYINRKGREAQGIVADEDATALKAELMQKLESLRDPESTAPPIQNIYDSALVYSGPYVRNAPELIVGYASGYRASWEGALGECKGQVFSDNEKTWSGDHCVDHSLVPGIFLCNKPLNTEDEIKLMDIAPSCLQLFGVPIPGYMDGRPMPLKTGRT